MSERRTADLWITVLTIIPFVIAMAVGILFESIRSGFLAGRMVITAFGIRANARREGGGQ